MKEKRYFCDVWYGPVEKGERTSFVIVVALLGFILISSFINYSMLLSKYENELNSYSTSAYQYIDEIADEVIQEGEGIDLISLPNDIVEYEVTRENKKIIFKYYLDNNKGMEFAESANMTVKLSDEFEIISKVPNYSSEEDYISHIKSDMRFLAIMRSFIICVILMLVGIIVAGIVAHISKVNKNKEQNLS